MCHSLEVSKNLLGSCFDVLQQQSTSVIIEWVVAEFTILFVIRAFAASVKPFAGETFVQVEAFVSLGTPVKKVKLAQLPHLRRIRVVGIKAFLGRSWAFPSHEGVARLVGLPLHLLLRLVLSPLQLPVSLVPLAFSFLVPPPR
jgi:hypothetical protein